MGPRRRAVAAALGAPSNWWIDGASRRAIVRGLLRTSLNTEGAHGVPSPAPSAAGRAAPAEGRPDRTLAELPVGEDGVVAAVGGERLFRRRLLHVLQKQ